MTGVQAVLRAMERAPRLAYMMGWAHVVLHAILEEPELSLRKVHRLVCHVAGVLEKRSHSLEIGVSPERIRETSKRKANE
jgi:hypothetical protein